ncbi:alpha/beta fold hydrolase, partial [Psychrobacter sp. W2-37-MNA-CIBAN-0211]
LLHGEPSWSFLYRKMIPILVAAGHRVIVPDLIGFGRSDKPSQRSDYTYQRHVDWIKSFVLQLELTNITLVCQDWGGLIGLRMA